MVLRNCGYLSERRLQHGQAGKAARKEAALGPPRLPARAAAEPFVSGWEARPTTAMRTLLPGRGNGNCTYLGEEQRNGEALPHAPPLHPPQR
ncbi:hypothetical protein NDU88_006712 [Pleurodeles waltl]|uniref:Uncharacterized protein n=1 Tax=Pleurodeles waltl TaxID=8319 RepID=A0AAV7MD08_PLEWA|nr:hypothetical protein NDU88_006712 [Pleurodeles waltl]